MIQTFLQKYKDAFGNAVPLPIAFGYSHVPATEVKRIPRCMVGAIRKVCDGEPLTLSGQRAMRRRKAVHGFRTHAGEDTRIRVRNGTLQTDAGTGEAVHPRSRHTGYGKALFEFCPHGRDIILRRDRGYPVFRHARHAFRPVFMGIL